MPSNNTSSAPESPVIPKAQEKPWYIQHFTKLLIGFGLGGSTVAILLPWMLWLLCGMSSGSSDQLRLHLLYVTGGIIAVLTLLQTNWKNQGDRLKIDADIKKNEQDAEKNERDHIRQVHAERRSRYTAAVGQLADEKAAIRLGGIYTLVGLVDEWLADNTLTKEEQQKEGQVIINNLCSYIRSPFPTAEKINEYEARKKLETLKKQDPKNLSADMSSRLKVLRERFKDSAEYEEPKDITADYAKFHEEQDVRRAIFEEMSKHCSKVSMNKSMEVTVTPGAWSGFKFDFSRAPIFYPSNNLIIEQGQFTSARFYSGADFRGAMFAGDADFGGAEFTEDVYFRHAKFTGDADFRGAMFAGDAHFWDAEFVGDAHFRGAEFAGDADFRGTKFTRDAYIWGAEFGGDAHFWDAEFVGNAHFRDADFTEDAHFTDARFIRGADFRGAEFVGNTKFVGAEFAGDADFRGTKFTGNPHFLDTKFTGNTDFMGAEFGGDADFRNTEFTENALFGGVKFTEDAYFTDAEFAGDADFRGTKFTGDADFWGVKFTGNAYFMDAEFTRNALFGDAEVSGSTDFDRAYFEKYAPAFADLSHSARFSAQVGPQEYRFKTHPESPHGFSCGEAELFNRTFILPLGAVLYDPDSWDEETQEYTRFSEPAQ
ncbi:pentapeptide repeat-containing protein [Rothia mucilaginosa]|uniref:pentapeptide repeat-containing protein n=1 Tax=Rothia mucilaginosa TaxID=43675 RepID=UPI0028DC0C93|nr:pentapeptide repeat-containing protein [Rothia mucilaginosa]